MPVSLPVLRTLSRISVILGAVPLAICACGSGMPETTPTTPAKQTQEAKRGTKRTNPSGGEPPPWMLLQELPSLRRVTKRERSQHLGGDIESETLANQLAEAYATLDRSQRLPAGAVLVTAHYRAGSEEPVVYFAMIKRPAGFDPASGDWEYLVIRPTGEVQQRGRLALCARCHAEAPRDSVFGQTP